MTGEPLHEPTGFRVAGEEEPPAPGPDRGPLDFTRAEELVASIDRRLAHAQELLNRMFPAKPRR